MRALGDDRAPRHHHVRHLADRDPHAEQSARANCRRWTLCACSARPASPGTTASWLWFFERVGRRRCPIINISGGTEIAGCFLFPLPIQPLKPCTLGGPAPGMATEVVDENGVPVRGRKGYLVCTKPAPSMTRGIWSDPKRYIDTYWSRFPGMWYHGDWASVDEDGHWFVHGRADESMNVAGRKVGPAEVEEAMMQHPGVAEAAVIGVPDELKGEAIVGFAVAKPG